MITHIRMEVKNKKKQIKKAILPEFSSWTFVVSENQRVKKIIQHKLELESNSITSNSWM
jgi:hypothetical protein